jgi:hypothetical protein
MKKFLVILIIMSLYPSIALAIPYEVETTGEYVMGDQDTKVDARRIALEHAKLLAVEQIGTYLESETIVKDGQVTKDEIRTYASAIVKTTVISENISLLENKTTIFQLKIRASIDIGALEIKENEIKTNVKRKEQIAALQSENLQLIKELERLSAKLKNEKAEEYRGLRQERENLFDKLEKNQNSIRIVFEKGTFLNLALEDKAKLKEGKNKIDDALKFISDNVKLTVGEPKIRYKGNAVDLTIDVKWQIEDMDEVRNKMAPFYAFHANTTTVSMYYFKGENKGELFHYLRNKNIKVCVEIERWIQCDYILYSGGSAPVYLTQKKSKSFTFSNVPIKGLDQITKIDTKVVITPKKEK